MGRDEFNGANCRKQLDSNFSNITAYGIGRKNETGTYDRTDGLGIGPTVANSCDWWHAMPDVRQACLIPT